jgi:MFS family permease
LFISMLAFSAPTGPISVAVQDLILPRARATAVALIGVLAGVVGAGLGPVLIGAVSDLIQVVEPGSNSLRIALVAVSFPLLVTSAIYWLLARRIDAAQT